MLRYTLAVSPEPSTHAPPCCSHRAMSWRGASILVAVWCTGASCTPFLASGDVTFSEASQTPADAARPSAPAFESPADDVQYLKAQPVSPQAQFGFLVAADREALVVAAPFEIVERGGESLRDAGAIYVLNARSPKDAPTRLVAPDVRAGDGKQLFEWLGYLTAIPFVSGLVPAISENVVVVGAPVHSCSEDPDDDSCANAGAVYAYERENLSEHSIPQYITAPRPHSGAAFGTSVAASTEWLAIGAPGETVNGATRAGAVYLYRRTGGRFEDEPVLIESPGAAEGLFGAAVSLDGDVLAVGAPAGYYARDGMWPDGTGTVYVYRRGDAGWEMDPLSTLVPSGSDLAAAYFGFSVKVWHGTIAIGAIAANGCEEAVFRRRWGAVYVANDAGAGAGFKLGQCLRPRRFGEVGALFGFSVELSDDHLVVGAPWDACSDRHDKTCNFPEYSGAAYTFHRGDGGTWQEQYYVKAPDARPLDVFGTSVALAGETLLVGAPQESGSSPDAPPDDPTSPYSGAAYLIDLFKN